MVSDILIQSALLEARQKSFEVDDFLRGFKHLNPEIVQPFEIKNESKHSKSIVKGKKKKSFRQKTTPV